MAQKIHVSETNLIVEEAGGIVTRMDGGKFWHTAGQSSTRQATSVMGSTVVAEEVITLIQHTQSTRPVSSSNTQTNSPNPFLLSASENPGNILVTQPLLGMKNYQSWSRAMVLALTAKKKIGFVNGKIEKLEVDSPFGIMYCETAREMWLELQRVFSQGNGPKIYNLQQEISQITQSQLSVTEYYSKFKKLWDQLLHYEPLPACTCGAMKILSIAHEKSHVMRFLMGLNENFEIVRSHILMLEPFPSMSKVYSLILQEEAHKGIGHGHGSTYIPKPDSMAMYVNTKGNPGSKAGPKKERPLCTHCNMLGHTVDKCYKLHGYPPGYKQKGKFNVNQVSFPQGAAAENASAQCPITKAQCEQLLALFKPGIDQGQNHHVASVSTSGSVSRLTTEAHGVPAATSVPPSLALNNSNFIDTMSGTASSLSFKPTLQHSIFSAKIVDKECFHTTDWVIDTGATDHMDLAHWSTLGLGKECNGLYLLERSNSTSLSASISAAIPSVHSTHGYKVLDLATQSVFLSRDVIFHEHSFPFASVSNSVSNSFTSCDDVVAPSSSAGNDSFVTPISVPDFVPNDIDKALFPSFISTDPVLHNDITSSLMSTDVSPSSSQDYACTAFAPSAAYDLAECITYSHLEPGYQTYLMTVGSSPQEPQSFSRQFKIL
uniref:Retrotransposon Copia-like N-terminal domain-containing protein n=1 Tax=Quercus lobata TaxID=97700 RepID=A0A7N2MV26_QUELO